MLAATNMPDEPALRKKESAWRVMPMRRMEVGIVLSLWAAVLAGLGVLLCLKQLSVRP
jgi:hypothetical protein